IKARLVNPPSSAVSALSTTTSRGAPTGVIKSQPETTWHLLFFLPMVALPPRCCHCSVLSESSFLGCFGAVHYNLQRCADWGDQVPARNHLAIHPLMRAMSYRKTNHSCMIMTNNRETSMLCHQLQFMNESNVLDSEIKRYENINGSSTHREDMTSRQISACL
ncbi:Hypothetical predicted protein, partial [Mytilus galloprovincialis]